MEKREKSGKHPTFYNVIEILVFVSGGYFKSGSFVNSLISKATGNYALFWTSNFHVKTRNLSSIRTRTVK